MNSKRYSSALLRDLRRYHTKGPKKFSSQVSREDVVAAKDRLVSNLEAFERSAGADLAALLQSEMLSLVENYEALKARAGKLDFGDLLIRTRNLLRDNDSVRNFMQLHLTHLCVDEFQDTDPIQVEILMLLSADDRTETDWHKIQPVPGKLFMVGDPKQSIYRFRRADIIMYQDLCQRLRAKGVGLEYLTRSFRAVRPIQDAVNAAFAPEMTGDPGNRTARIRARSRSLRQAREQPERDHQACSPYPYGSQRVSNEAIDRCLPETVAAYIDLADSRQRLDPVRDPLDNDRLVPIASQHIADPVPSIHVLRR